MFYKIQLKEHVRVPPDMFKYDLSEAILKELKRKFEGLISEELGIVIDVLAVGDIGQGIIIPGDGAAYYETTFDVVSFKPEMKELVFGTIRDIADFGAFMTIGPIDGMIHISQTMDDYVSFAKEKVLSGKESKKSLKVGDQCMARIIAISYKDITNPKFGLTMRQPGLGRLDWVEEEGQKEKEK
ncbi:DNA-directed RNA polymerase [Candidatus Woesearchaeota archaeon CG_4_10_14_0_2_um_filter_57_5]|nr:MAG: DNA-directed RNA polymerase [Candidatus Woesearchaeota archaeon CG1_02_57_44]PIZ52844.1 MAG: DNA-directed RNA polymerase [Candidatus Woesearchaeota archaeon CG_4_10_14_0_2_um_filter_57_5]